MHASVWNVALMSVEAPSIQALMKTVGLLPEQRVCSEFVTMDHVNSGFTEDSLNSYHQVKNLLTDMDKKNLIICPLMLFHVSALILKGLVKGNGSEQEHTVCLVVIIIFSLHIYDKWCEYISLYVYMK